MKLHQTRDIIIGFSNSDFSDLENQEVELPNPHLKEAFRLIDIDVDPLRFYNKYPDQGGTGDAYYFESSGTPKDILFVNIYWALSDQFDGVTLAIRAFNDIELVKSATRAFYDSASCQFRYEERNISKEIDNFIDKRTYPKTIEESNYQQRLHYMI